MCASTVTQCSSSNRFVFSFSFAASIASSIDSFLFFCIVQNASVLCHADRGIINRIVFRLVNSVNELSHLLSNIKMNQKREKRGWKNSWNSILKWTNESRSIEDASVNQTGKKNEPYLKFTRFTAKETGTTCTGRPGCCTSSATWLLWCVQTFGSFRLTRRWYYILAKCSLPQ